MAKRRTKIDIINDMLCSIQIKGGNIKPTHLMYKANLSHQLMQSYLEELIENEMVEEIFKGDYKYLSLTDKGFDFLAQFKKMKEFQEAFGL